MLAALYANTRRSVSGRLAAGLFLALAALALSFASGCTTVKILTARRPVVKSVAQGLSVLRDSNDPAMRVAAYQFLLSPDSYPDRRVPDEILETVAQAWHSEPEPVLRMQALLALGKLEDDRVTRQLLSALADPDPLVRQTACELLGDRRESTAVGPLSERLTGDVSVDVRLAAADALAEIGTREAAEALYRSLADADPAIRLHARELLARLVGADYGSDMTAWQQAVQQASFEAPRKRLAWWPF